MILKNYLGIAWDFNTEVENKYNTLSPAIYAFRRYYPNSTVYVMNGPIPSTDVIYEIMDKHAFESAFGDNIIARFDNRMFYADYDKLKKEKILRHAPDALDFNFAIDGTIGWVAVQLHNRESELYPTDIPIFTYEGYIVYPSITTITDNEPHESVMILSSLETAVGNETILKYDLQENISLEKYILTLNQSDSNNYNAIDYALISYSDDGINYNIINKPVFIEKNIYGRDRLITDLSDISTRYIKIQFIMKEGLTSIRVRAVSGKFYTKLSNEESFIFTDSVGVWEDDNVISYFEVLSGNQGAPNIFKDFTIAMRDASNIEIEALPVVTYEPDNSPGVVNIYPISDGFITHTEKLEPLVISGTTIDIEDNQPVLVTLNGQEYSTTVNANTWSLTIDDISALEDGVDYIVKVEVRDIAGNLATAEQTITVAGTNVGPVITVSDTLFVDEDNTISVDMTVVDADETVSSVVVSALNGTVSFDSNLNKLSYTPNTNFNGSDTITITATDSLGAESTKVINVNVNPINDAPTITGATNITIDEDTPTTIPFTFNDIDSTFTVEGVSNNGTSVWDGTNLIYTPNADFNGIDTLTITITDADGLTDSTSIDITITPVNDNPIVVVDNATVIEDNSIAIPISISDIDSDISNITISALNGTALYNVSNSDAPVIDYTPNTDFSGEDTITIIVDDVDGGQTIKTINVTVTPVNDQIPTLVIDPLTYETNEDTPITIAITATDDREFEVTGIADNGSVEWDQDNSTIIYTPNNDFNGTDTVVITASDFEGGSVSETLTITVLAVNDAPIIDTVDSIEVVVNSTTDINVTINDIDGDTLAYNITAGVGTVTFDETNKIITYTATDTIGSDTITLTVNDGVINTVKDIAVSIIGA